MGAQTITSEHVDLGIEPGPDSPASVTERFSLTKGGPSHWLFALLGGADDYHLAVRSALFAVAVTWLPMFVLSPMFVVSLMRGRPTDPGLTIPFLRDFAVNVRFLITLPILLLAEPFIDRKWRLVIGHFLKSKLVTDPDVPAFEALLARVRRLRDRILPELLLLFGALSPSLFLSDTEVLMTGLSTWRTTGAGHSHLTMAGLWFNFVSAPLFRFLLFRWLWRLCLLTLVLWRASRLKLYLVATHADLAAGLGFLSFVPRAFSPIVFAGGTVMAAQVANAIAYEGETLSSMKLPLITYGVFAIILLVVPLTVVTSTLRAVKNKALFAYGALVTIQDQQFDQAWIRGVHPPGMAILGDAGPSSLIDLGSSFVNIKRMSIVPLDKHALLVLSAAAAAPMLPLILWATPAEELLRMVMQMLR